MSKGMAHMEEVHPEMAADIKAMPHDDPKMVEWNQKFQADWASKPEDAPEEDAAPMTAPEEAHEEEEMAS